jgi:AraC-like DNA-binding protein
MEFVRAASPLPGRIASAVGYRSEGQPPGIHRGVPSPYLTFIVSLAEPITTGESVEHARGPRAHRNDIILAGLHTRPAYVVRPSGEAGIQLAIHPLASRALFGAPASELAPLTLEGSDLLGGEADRLRERLVDEDSWPGRFEVLSDYVRDRVERTRGTERPRDELVEAWTWMARHGGCGSMDGLARHVALSGRQLGTLFLRELGLGPKHVSRLMRFNRARQRIAATLNAERPLSLADTAYACGYYDQSHLVRDFRQFVGTSPTAWIAEERRNIQAGGHQHGAGSPA